MKHAKKQCTVNAMELAPKSPAKNRSSTLLLGLSVFSAVVILGCVALMPRSSEREQTVQPSPVVAATQPASATVQSSPVPATQESECTRLNLTSQECASLGQQWFTLSGVVDGYCWYGESDRTVTRDLLVTVSFASDGSGTRATITNAAFVDCETISRTAENTYTYDCVAHANHHTGIITFVDNGFLNVGRFTNSVDKNCSWSEAYELR